MALLPPKLDTNDFYMSFPMPPIPETKLLFLDAFSLEWACLFLKLDFYLGLTSARMSWTFLLAWHLRRLNWLCETWLVTLLLDLF